MKSKKVILIAPTNNDYPIEIKKELENYFCEVHFYDERNHPSFIDKVIYRKKPSLFKRKINKYYSSIADKEKDFNPDYVLFISPETINEESLLNLKKCFANAKFILYMWDSIENKNVKNIFSLFDRVLSFDDGDCNKYGFVFRPLFYSSTYENYSDNISTTYGLSFIGTAHSDRAKLVYNTLQECKKAGIEMFCYVYAQGKFMFLKNYFSNKYFRKLTKLKLTHSKLLDKKDAYKIMLSSICILDINHPLQTGLTMRTIEAIGFNKKLITTNQHIKKYDFFNENNILLIERNDCHLNTVFLNGEYFKLDANEYKKYSLKQWIADVFEA